MLAIDDTHKPFSHEMRMRLKTTSIGLGLVRLLQDAGQIEEGRQILALLQNGCEVPAAPAKARRARLVPVRLLPATIPLPTGSLHCVLR